MADAAPGIVYMLDRMGVPFNRTPEGLLDFRRFGGTLFHRTAFAGATTGQQLLYALDEQVRRYETIDVEDEQGRSRPGREDGPQVRVLGLPAAWCSTTAGICRGIVAQDLKTMSIKSFPGDAVCLATGGCGIIFGTSTNSVINTGTAASAVYQQGACYANGEFIQVHPTAIPGADKLRLISESARGEGGRVWVPQATPKEQRPGRDVPEKRPRLLPRGEVPRLRQPRAARHRQPRALQEVLPRGARRLQPEERQERERGLPRRHAHPGRDAPQEARGHPRDLREVRRRRPVQQPDAVFPAVHYSMGGLWVDFERDGQRLARDGVAAQPRDQHPRPLRRAARCDYQYHGANRLGANSLLSCIYGGMVTGPGDRDVPQEHGASSAYDLPTSLFEQRARSASETKYEAHPRSMRRRREPVRPARGARRTRCSVDCTIERAQRDARQGAREDRARSTSAAKRVGVTDTATGRSNQGAQFVRHLQNMIVLARVIAQGARNRDESRGAHFKPEFPKRDDANLHAHHARAAPGIVERDARLGEVRPRSRLRPCGAAGARHRPGRHLASSGRARASTSRPAPPAPSRAAAPAALAALASRRRPPPWPPRRKPETMARDRKVRLKIKTAGRARRVQLLGGVRAAVAAAHERDQRAHGDPEAPGHRRRHEGHAGGVGAGLASKRCAALHDGHQRPRAAVVHAR